MTFYSSILTVSVILVGIGRTGKANFSPIKDDDLYEINWSGQTNIEKIKHESNNREIILMQTEENEYFQCVIPESRESIDATRKATYNGPSPDELMKELFSSPSCSYRIESYWTYELCHGKHIRQYHDNKELGVQVKTQEYFLGKMNTPKEPEHKDPPSKDVETQPNRELRTVKIDGLELPYYGVEMGEGTTCDLTGKPRLSHVKYICQPNGRGEIYHLKETSSCEYDVIILTAVLCRHPSFKPKDPPVSPIDCHAMDGSPQKPSHLAQLLQDEGILLEPQTADNIEAPSEGSPLPQGAPATAIPSQTTAPQRTNAQEANTKIGIEADKSLLRDFLAGDYCIHGGSGWWKHEFCYKKHAKQYHEDKNGDTVVFLGHWDKEQHLQWLNKNPSKRPKPLEERKFVSMLYTNGDVCDLTNKPRFVEVKLKCLKDAVQPHAVSIYLVEPSPCEYILGVESPLLCNILEEADQNGLLDHVVL
ncbi:endoplasmic reticulum lectin 1-like isoform X1 [Dreissena polymorpha]|uniref:endoplasmic reticulum lectin 1-like isoform X1 n=1 Tax=Dreissena polymorpha TaxID=45954 RepID=UPI002264754F|nr:endoplasmic reticulum lectin 1-like isoform X1 [Dreissena polymorpha]